MLFRSDYNVFLEFHMFYFLIKDRVTRRTLHRRWCIGGLYPLISTTSTTQKQAFFASKPSKAWWHICLGHPSSVIVRKILSQNIISYVKDLHPESICDSCQLAKSHQIPYPISTSVSTFPLQLIFSDVWGPAPKSIGRHEYYVSFIDDYSKFMWIYLLKCRSDVLQVFKKFRNLLSDVLIAKSLPCGQIGRASCRERGSSCV